MSIAENSDLQKFAHNLIVLVRQMAHELHPDQNLDKAVDLDKSLDRHLGFDSLSRMELFHRAEKVFSATLPERALNQIDTPRDLLRELSIASEKSTPHGKIADIQIAIENTGATAAPQDMRTLNEVLAWHATQHPDRLHIHLFNDEDSTNQGSIISYGELFNGARQVAAGILARQLAPRESVVIMLPTGPDYFYSFFGVLLAGGVPVPVYPPGRPQQLEEHLRRHAAIAANACAGLMITVPEAMKFSRLLTAQLDDLREVITCAELMASESSQPYPAPNERDTAFIQYTSGSTGDPKGVVLSHANLLANVHVMGEALNADSGDVFVSWLPLYHDMGLIGAWLGSLTHAVPLVVMSPLSFLARPQRWLWAIHQYGGSISGAPNFAYDACVSRIRDEDIEGLDLSSWRVAFNGAEAVSPGTMERFTERFADYGFHREAFMPVYGLAENSVGLAFPPLDRGPRIDIIDREAFSHSGHANTTTDGSLAVPSCGAPLPGHQIRVVDDTGFELPDRREGLVQFQGLSSTTGYFRNQQATAGLFDGDWLISGDRGYMAEGEIFITGRQKDLIIRAGRNIYPAELEDAIGNIDGIQKGNVAVFAGQKDDTEKLIVMAECRRRDETRRAEIQEAVNGVAIDITGAPPDDIVLAPPRSVPKTSSGKVRRQAARQLYESGTNFSRSGRGVSVHWQIFRLLLASAVPQLRRAMRFSASWAYAIYACLLLVLLAPITWLLVLLTPSKSVSVALVRIVLRLLWRLAGVKVTVRGLENIEKNIPKNRPVILVSNHASYIDGSIILSSLPIPVSFVAKSELKGHFISRLFLNKIGTVFVERFVTSTSIKDADQATAALTNGQNIVYFPEGTFTRMPGLLPFQMGAFTAAIETGTPIVPVTLHGTRMVLRGDTGFPRPNSVMVTIQPPLFPDASENLSAEEKWQAALSLRANIRSQILANCGEPDLGHERILHLLDPGKR